MNLNNDHQDASDVIDLTRESEAFQGEPEVTQDGYSGSLGNPKVWWKIVIGNLPIITITILCSMFHMLCKKYCFQLELSPEGYSHYQCLLGLKDKKRKQTLLMLLSQKLQCPMANIQLSPSDCKFVQYCSKIETRIDGPWSKGFPSVLERPPKLIKRDQMYAWQKSVLNIIETTPSDRLIYWYYDRIGNTGKTSLVKYLIWHYNAFYFGGKASDMASRIIMMDKPPEIAIMNISRTQEQYVSYQGIEEIKDGLIQSGKYEGGQKIFDPPHILIFANFEPDKNALSEDRWMVRDVTRALNAFPRMPIPVAAEAVMDDRMQRIPTEEVEATPTEQDVTEFMNELRDYFLN